MAKKKDLDYLLIPNSKGKTKKQRKERAKHEIKKRNVKKLLVLNGRDSEEDILYLGKKLKKGDRIGIDTFPLHYKEYLVLIKKAKRDGNFPKGVKVENIQTSQTKRQFIYGILGLSEEKIKKRKLDYVKNRDERVLQKIKKFVKAILRIN